MTAAIRLDSLVVAACASHADAPALLGEDAAFTYRELGSAADSEASRLTAAGLQPGMPTIVPVSNQAGDVAAMIGVWRAGGVVVPVHRATPRSVVAALVARTGAGHTGGRAPRDWPSPSPGRVPAPVSADSAYVLFTSGSTGQPKGVVLSHQALGASSRPSSRSCRSAQVRVPPRCWSCSCRSSMRTG